MCAPVTLEETEGPPMVMSGPDDRTQGVPRPPLTDDRPGEPAGCTVHRGDDRLMTSGKQRSVQDSVQGGPGVGDRPLGAGARPKCVYRRGGICNTHGEGAIRKWKPTRTVVVDDKGAETIRKGKKMFWVCDLDNKHTKVKQTTLSFFSSTPVRNQMMSDTEQRGGRLRDFQTTTAGQQPACVRGDVTSLRQEMTDEN